jgi:hypothetical protein
VTLVPELARRHQARIASDPDYQAFLRDLEFTRQQREKTTVSLLENQRRAERERIETWQRERENRYRAAKGFAAAQARRRNSGRQGQRDSGCGPGGKRSYRR